MSVANLLSIRDGTSSFQTTMPQIKRPSGAPPEPDAPALKRPAAAPNHDEDADPVATEDGEMTGTFQERLDAFREFAKDKTPAELESKLKVYFTDVEMSSWWNKLARDRNNDKKFAQDVDTIVDKTTGSTHAAKRSVLALRIRDPTTFKSTIAEQTLKISGTDTEKKGCQWVTRGQLEQQLGVAEATRQIERGKWQVQYDSDDDSEYFLPFHESSKSVIKDEATVIKHSAAGASDNFAALKKAMDTKHMDLLQKFKSRNSMQRLSDGSPRRMTWPSPSKSIANAETDEERVTRLLEEKQEAQKAEREAKKAEPLAAKQAAPENERVVADAQDVDKQLGNDQDKLATSVKKLKAVKHAQSLKQSCERLIARMNEKQKQIQKELKKDSPAIKELKELVKDGQRLCADKTEHMDKPIRAFLASEKKK